MVRQVVREAGGGRGQETEARAVPDLPGVEGVSHTAAATGPHCTVHTAAVVAADLAAQLDPIRKHQVL